MGISVQACIRGLGVPATVIGVVWITQSISAQEPVNVLGVPDRHVFCSSVIYHSISHRKPRYLKRKLLGMAYLPLAYFKISNCTDKSSGRGCGYASNPDPRHYWEPFLVSQKCLSLDQNYSVGCVDATSRASTSEEVVLG